MNTELNCSIETNKSITPKLKVCGLCIPEQINFLKNLNVDFLGFIFYQKSPRYALKKLDIKDIFNTEHSGKIGVFVNENIQNIIEISKKAGLNYIQLHGDNKYENLDFINNIRKILPKIKIIKVFRIGEKEFIEDLQKKIYNVESACDFILFDTDTKLYGGTGKSFDWTIINDLNLRKPYFLSGGISTENISNIKKLKNVPFAIDINSKFEKTPGNKNLTKIIELQKLIQLGI